MAFDLQTMLDWISAQPMWIGLASLGLGAGIEYVFPPFPGDTITLIGAVLIPQAGWPWWAVFGAVIVGSLLGSALNWWLGTWLANRKNKESSRIGRWLYGDPKRVARLERLTARFEKYGSAYIAINRFVPAFRSIFFVGAGLAGLPLGRVMVFAALSAALWNGALMGVGALVGYNIDSLASVVTRYGQVALGVIIGLGVLWLVRKMWRAHRDG